MIFALIKNPALKALISSALRSKKFQNESSLNPSCEFFMNQHSFIEAVKTRPCHMAIIETGQLNVLNSLSRIGKDGFPVLGVVTKKEVKEGIQKLHRYGIQFYILPPYRKEDISYKIITAQQNIHEKALLEAIIDISKKVSTTLDVFEILYYTVKKIAEIIPVTRCSIVKIPPSMKYAHVVATYEDPDIRNITLDLKKYPEIQKALMTRQPVIIKNALKDPLMKDVYAFISPLRIKSIIVIPIVYKEETIGALFLRTSRQTSQFKEAEINFLQAAANASANALYNAFLFEEIKQEKHKLEKLAITDYLTGLYNNRYFFHRLEEEFEKARRYNTPVSCIMIDLDHFKSINDTFGHRKGDGVLRELGQLLRKNTRKGDIIARYGGEEFIMLLPHTDREGAIKEAERLRHLISSNRFKILDQPLTASFGISTWPHSEIKNPDDLITVADNALYMAKNQGRNRVCIC